MDHQLSAPASASESTVANRLCHIVRVVFYMIRKGFTKHKLMMELDLLLKRSKVAGKALGNLMTFHHHNHHQGGGGCGGGHRHHHDSSSNLYSSLTCRYMDPNLACYNPREVEFSCSNTPSFPPFHSTKSKSDRKRRRREYELDAAMIAKAFEMLNSEASDAESSGMPSTSATPLWSIYEKSPAIAAARQLRITDSPFLAREEEEGSGNVGQVDMKAEEFIRRFYEDLQRQQRTPPETQDDWHRRRRSLAGLN